MPYQIVEDPQLQVIKNRIEKLPKKTFGYYQHGLYILGTNHNTISFNAQSDGSAEITFSDSSLNDTFNVTMHMSLISYHIDLKKNHEFYSHQMANGNSTCTVHKLSAFAITIGDLFKLFYKQHHDFFDRKQSKKHSRKGTRTRDDEELDEQQEEKREKEREDEEDRARIVEHVHKAQKISAPMKSDPRNVIGAVRHWGDSKFRLWRFLSKEGQTKNYRGDFTSFCSSMILLPLFSHDPHLVLEDKLISFVSYDLIKRIIRYYLFSEDPEARLVPGREYFTQPKSLLDICEFYSEELSNRITTTAKRAIARKPNQNQQHMLDTVYTEQLVFDNIGAVEETYPVYALRNIFLESWCTEEDGHSLEYLVRTAIDISRSDKCQTIIAKRGKVQKYATYDHHGDYWRDYLAKPRQSNIEMTREASDY